ncbi:MAG: molybdopterin molybdotransferase MoeA [Desulfamplus sp.]|nr:molybdopterin molybdotransferase MoeA [Desulfamplus sp.]
MNHFFKVKTLEQVEALADQFSCVSVEKVPITDSFFRILAKDIDATHDIPGFRRATMDGYALHSGSTFGASESNPAWLEVIGSISMGESPSFSIQSGQAAKISTGGMLPDGADSVVMVEHTEVIGGGSAALTGADRDKSAVSYSPTVEIYKSVAPLQNVIDKDEDFKKGDKILKSGTQLRPQEVGLAAALGICELPVYKIPKVGIISTGDEIVPIDEIPQLGKIRDINSYTLAGLITEAGAIPIQYGIIKDNEEALLNACLKALDETDMVLISGGSSVGNRDFTVNVLSSLKDTEILVHGISISPGKPTILAKSGKKPIWGLPGHVVSAMVVFKIVVLPFLRQIQGLSSCKTNDSSILIPAILTKNVASAQGRTDFIRVRFVKQLDINLKYKYQIFAEPILGKSGLIRTMVMADGLLEIGENVEGVERGDLVNIIPLRTLD